MRHGTSFALVALFMQTTLLFRASAFARIPSLGVSHINKVRKFMR
jgi:hypothetical protein